MYFVVESFLCLQAVAESEDLKSQLTQARLLKTQAEQDRTACRLNNTLDILSAVCSFLESCLSPTISSFQAESFFNHAAAEALLEAQQKCAEAETKLKRSESTREELAAQVGISYTPPLPHLIKPRHSSL